MRGSHPLQSNVTSLRRPPSLQVTPETRAIGTALQAEEESTHQMQTLARWSTKHRRLVVGLWLLCLVGSVGLASGLKNRFVNNVTLPNTEAQRATDLLKSRFPGVAGDSDQIVFRAGNGTLADVATRAKVTSTLAAVAKLPHVTGVASPYA